MNAGNHILGKYDWFYESIFLTCRNRYLPGSIRSVIEDSFTYDARQELCASPFLITSPQMLASVIKSPRSLWRRGLDKGFESRASNVRPQGDLRFKWDYRKSQSAMDWSKQAFLLASWSVSAISVRNALPMLVKYFITASWVESWNPAIQNESNSKMGLPMSTKNRPG